MTERVKRSQASAELSTNDLLRAILVVLLDERELRASERPGYPRSEIILANAGMDYQVIAQLLGKNPDAVRMALSRARKASEEKSTKTPEKKAPARA